MPSYESKNVSVETFSKVFRMVAGSSLASCGYIKEVEGYLSTDLLNILRSGTDVGRSRIVFADTLSICFGGSEVSSDVARVVAAAYGCRCIVNGAVDVEGIISRYCGSSNGLGDSCDVEIESHTEKYDGSDIVEGIDFGNEEDNRGDLDDGAGDAEGGVEPDVSEPSEEDGETEPEVDEASKEAICRYYSAFYNAPIQNLMKRYSSMFASGYEVSKPAGVLSTDGIVRVSGSSRVVYEDSISTSKIYELVRGYVNFRESGSRSIVKIGNEIYDGYKSGGILLYFPNKMLEFAYGLEAPTGDNQDSLRTYNRHASARSWSGFKSGELEKSVRRLVRGLLFGFVSKKMSDEGIESYKDSCIADVLQEYMRYVEACLSFCILFTDYKVSRAGGEENVSVFTLRVCDPTGTLLGVNLTEGIIGTAFLGGSGKDPHSYMPRVEQETCVVEYSHEFNHSLAQATPLFAYKALESIMAEGKSISWDNLILGKGEDGKILKCGEGGFINLGNWLTHEIDAGSRAGKGVMTLNLLASGIASMKNLFYLDCKPDMASILKYMCPNMFVVNGGGYDANYDSMNQWGPDKTDMFASKNVPQEVLDVFEVRVPNWNELGDLFYMRALMLLLGILLGRGSGRGADPEWGGTEGMLIIVDEFRVFQANYRSLLNLAFAKIPNTILEKSQEALKKGSITKVEFDRCYNNANYYALSYVNSLSESLKFLSKKRDAGFDSSEVKRSDIFIIGQDLYDGPVDISEFANSFIKSSASNRYKTNAVGMNSTFGSNICGAKNSIPYSMLHFKGADAFFGRNVDTNYLAQTNAGSKAYGRLDDKASNFAYLSSFTEGIRNRINGGNIADNMRIAGECKYFKPYLILNESSMDSRCVKDMFDRCYNNAGIPKEEIIAENPDPNNPSVINPAVGFIDYIRMAGVADYEASMRKGADLADRIVNRLGYPGNWMDFICDLRPEWMFTVKDVVEVAQGRVPDLADPMTNPILAEWVAFNPERFGAGYKDPQELSANEMNEFLMDDSTEEDFSDDEKQFRDSDERLANAMGLNDSVARDLEDGGEVSLFEDDVEDKPDWNQVAGGISIEESGKETAEESSPEMQRLLDIIKELQEEVRALKSGDTGVSLESVGAVQDEVQYQSAESSSFGEEFNSIPYEDEIVSLEHLMTIITNDVIKRFGGIERFHSFRVIGGSLVVNGYYYRCNIKDIYAKGIPYDIRRKINSGNIAELFNYNLIYAMSSLRELEVDSINFAYDYVGSQMGMKDNIGIEAMFNSIKSLQVIKIGSHVFTRDRFASEKDELEDIYYRKSTVSKIADASQNYLKKWSSNSWSWTKRVATDKNCHAVLKGLGILGGTVASAATGAANLGVSGTRKIVNAARIQKAKQNAKGFLNGLKDLFET